MANGNRIYEALTEASRELFGSPNDAIVSWEDYEGMDREVYERAADIMAERGVTFP